MKKLITAILVSICLLSLTICANAVGGFVYKDVDSGNCLSLPEGWDLEYEDGSLVKVTFLPEDNNSALMQYGSTDYWNSLDADSKRKTPRTSFDNSHFSAADLAELVGCTSRDVKRITMNGTEYYRASFQKNVPSGKFSVTLDMTYWVRYHNGWIYVYQYVGSETNVLYRQFKDMIATASYSTPTEEKGIDTQEDTYENAVAAYESGDYEAARELFEVTPDYQDSSKYLRLIRIRSAGSKEDFGSEEIVLTEEEQKDIADASEDFSFADTAQVLLCNSSVASHYLTGYWSGGAGCYISFKTTDSGTTYTIGSKLSKTKPGSFTIENGVLSLNDSDTPLLKMALTSPDTMEVITYEMENQNYTLERK